MEFGLQLKRRKGCILQLSIFAT
uniref:Uncharacterized protein n=1 Tax=Arundo donax TaxID=35708 RepID=A0A0A8Z623_ARUDO